MSRQIGNKFENEFCRMAEALGYAAFPARGSRGPIDVLCFEDGYAPCDHGFRQPHPETPFRTCFGCQPARGLTPLAVQIGTTAKAISKTLEALDAAPRPIGSRVLVARRWGFRVGKRSRVRWTFHTAAGTFDSLKEAL